jgi:hypothetical protein
MQRFAVVAVVVLAACGPKGPRDPWMAGMGRRSPGWTSCLRIASAMRAECGADPSCANEVTTRYSYDCYWAAYDADKGSPCAPMLRGDLAAPCREAGVPAAQARVCVDELRYVTSSVCDGDFALTGAGP